MSSLRKNFDEEVASSLKKKKKRVFRHQNLEKVEFVEFIVSALSFVL